jgi:hypothetical protein
VSEGFHSGILAASRALIGEASDVFLAAVYGRRRACLATGEISEAGPRP